MIELYVPKPLKALWTTTKSIIRINGGRGSGKTYGIERFIIVKIIQKKIYCICARDLARGISESYSRGFKDAIAELGLSQHFKITDDCIKCIPTGSEITYWGLRAGSKAEQETRMRSLRDVGILWIDEAQSISSVAMQDLIPTVYRMDGSMVIFSYNPKRADEPVSNLENYGINPDSIIDIKLNYNNNTRCPKNIIEQAEQLKKTDYPRYRHEFLGEYLINTDSQIFNKKFTVSDFETPENVIFYHGLDFGFSVDPTAIVRCFIVANTLFIDREVYGKLEITELPEALASIPTAKNHRIYADSSRPETISYLRNTRYNVLSCTKWKGSVRDGIEAMRGFDHIYIHSRCIFTAREFNDYSYKLDPLTGLPTVIIEDKNNHSIDAIRYALQDVLRRKISRRIEIKGF